MGGQLAKTTLTGQQHFYLNTITHAADNLLVILNDILDLSKIGAGKLSIERIGFDPKKVVDNAMHVLMHKAEEKGLSLTNSFCDARLASVLIGDPYRLNQVMLNLMSNAIKFTEKGTVDITCKVLDATAKTQTVQVSVMDTGIGMDKVYVDRIFDKFTQEHESVTREFGGTGLGMSICNELVQLMGGQIAVQSKKGEGTTVSIVITFEIGTTDDIPVNKVSSITGNFLIDKTILVVDDNDMNRLVASTILQEYGATICEAVNGKEALLALGNHTVDLVLMDVQMPVMNGMEATRKIREAGSGLPIIALTANAIKGENDKCIAAGMNDYIAKPFKEDEFLKKIAYWLKTVFTLGTSNAVPEQPAEALYDLSALIAISKGNTGFVKKMLTLFCEQTPSLIQQMRVFYTEKSLEKMAALAHKIKPSIDNLKIESLKPVVRKIESVGKANVDSEELPRLLHAAETIVGMIVKKIQSTILNQ
jgi:CheY-like chemotaxis protein